ncbi:unnamed protein product [Peronospora belbahrii]|uniref:Fungal lipase-like domain-containing protein n=1 Tax=Peronospora belbahrii TaxID=622444 RepID=A0AAU9L421_9STRA|nr:unnamed protein product [Peronospora belbahrii]CAH0521365.1 unnamed protein product [Peronospora belbahrii]
MEIDLLLANCRELHHRGLLTSEELKEYEASLLASTTSSSDAIRKRVSSLLVQDADTIIERVRLRCNEQDQESTGSSDLTAVAVNSALGALNAWLRPTPTPASTTTPSTLWASALDGAVAILNASKRKQRVQQLKLQLMSGEVATCRHVVLCINGFMTQSDDPTNNWRVWTQGDEQQEVAVFAVQWEAGDSAAWNEFCAHVNDNINSSSVSSMIAHFTDNPWHSAQGKADQVGVLLAHVLAERLVLLQGRKISLFGHSLGGAVIYSIFQEMAKLRAEKKGDNLPLIANAVSFAGAFIPATEGLDNISNALDPKGGKFINVFSSRDGVLSRLFWALQLPGSNTPIAAGCHSLTFGAISAANCMNVEVSDVVVPCVENHFGHSYSQFMNVIKLRVLPHLFQS